jgi:hypothetical protein
MTMKSARRMPAVMPSYPPNLESACYVTVEVTVNALMGEWKAWIHAGPEPWEMIEWE